MDRIIIAERKGAAARIALLEEKAVREIHYFDAGSSEQANALYLARVQTVRPALNAAFVDIGSETEAFLPLEGEKLRPGDYLIVQGFATQTNPDKRYRVSRKVQLSGRTLVYQPGRARVSVSLPVSSNLSLYDSAAPLGPRRILTELCDILPGAVFLPRFQ